MMWHLGSYTLAWCRLCWHSPCLEQGLTILVQLPHALLESFFAMIPPQKG